MRERIRPDHSPPPPGPSPECARSRDRALRSCRTGDASSNPPCTLRDNPFALRNKAQVIGLQRAGRPALREDAHAILGAWIPRPGGDAPRDADAPLDNLVVAEVGKALGRPQHTLERSLAPCAEEGREIRLARLRVRGLVEAGAFAEPPIDVADGHHALPVAALEGRRLRLGPEHS